MMAGRGEEFLAASEVAVKQLKELHAQDPGNVQVRGNLASAYGLRGQHLLNTGETSELGARAMADLRKGAAVLERLIRQNPESTQLVICTSLRRSLRQLELREKQFAADAMIARDGNQLRQELKQELLGCG